MNMIDDVMETGRGAARLDAESSKRRDIIDGARRVFFDKGFDGASMDEVAKTAGVSKATIYAYFSGKEDLLEALVLNDRARSAESMFSVGASTEDVESFLRRIGTSFMTTMVQPDHIRLLRMVMGVAEKFPRIGRAFYDAGPCQGGQRLAHLLEGQARLGRLELDDSLAAAHLFFNMCHSNMVKALLFSDAPTPSPAHIEEHVNRAVRIFLAGYGTERRN